MTATMTVGSVAAFSKGSGLAKSDLTTDGAHPCIHYGELFTHYGAVIDIVRSRTNQDLAVKSEVGDVLMPTSDVTPSGLAKASAILCSGIGLGGDVLVIRPDRAKADPRFLAYAIRHDANQVLGLVRGSTVYHLYATDMRHFELPSLPIAEQARVADALKDADDLISALERGIVKKLDIKQGICQQLLTGRTRLGRFSKTWSEHLLGDVAHIKTGSRNNQDKKVGGQYPFFVRSATVERIDSYSYDCEAILVPGEGGIGAIFHYINGKFEVHQRVYKISEFVSEVSGRFVYYYMRHHFGSHAMENSVKATVDSLRLPTFRNFQLRLPDIEEQRAIVSVLDDVEAEVDALRIRLAKARSIKTGMMQELLTGRTRLPLGEAVA